MDAGVVAAALEEARFHARQSSRYEDLADDLRVPAELAEWEHIAQVLAAAPAGTVYDPDVDDVVQAELAADAAAAAAPEAELREAARIAARAGELQALRELGTLEQTEPRHGDEAVRDELTRRAGSYVQPDVDAWTEPPFGEPPYPGQGDPDYNPICSCPGPWPLAFCLDARAATSAGGATASPAPAVRFTLSDNNTLTTSCRPACEL
ncbi:hypothetical protein HET69_14570 [Streptomyces sp. CJ_13]|uniref:hypothetical protein n=1 Tax=Streptomyces sp. CJ_13 TaxID=2724943 RepID=UPI00202A57AE|nr:hypothetical protein [Streptomyces sp. CJ_13]MBT1185203.1 hypothetical protein [Streptomyces sp. CJ_13]